MSKTTKEALNDLERNMRRGLILLLVFFAVKIVIDIILIVEMLRT